VGDFSMKMRRTVGHEHEVEVEMGTHNPLGEQERIKQQQIVEEKRAEKKEVYTKEVVANKRVSKIKLDEGKRKKSFGPWGAKQHSGGGSGGVEREGGDNNGGRSSPGNGRSSPAEIRRTSKRGSGMLALGGGRGGGGRGPGGVNGLATVLSERRVSARDGDWVPKVQADL
jgi:hypothetical protein